MKVAIIGYGVVGKATHKTIQRQHEVMIHDPLQGLNSRILGHGIGQNLV